jgi:hypothetical protein
MAEVGGRSQRRRDHVRRRNRIIAISVAAVVALALVVGGVVVLTAEDEPTTTSASTSRRASTTSSSPTTTTTAAPTSTTIVPRSANPIVALAQQYDGFYAGTWTAASGPSGAASLELRIDPAAGTIAITGTFDGDFFGTGASLPRTIQATVAIGDPNAAVVTDTEAFGQVTGKLDPSLALVLDAPSVPDDKVKSFTMTGRLREDHTGFDATYTITNKNGSTVQGTVTTTCTPDRQRPSEVTTLCTPA